MSLQPQTDYAVPERTAEVARSAFPKGNSYMQMRTELGTLFQDEDFSCLYPECGQPAAAPWRLALVTIMQFAENLTDRQAADAVRARLDWKYALSLELEDSGFDFSVLSEFRGRLVEGGAEELLLDQMLDLFKEKKLIKARGRQRTDSTHILAAVRELNRLELVGETMLYALNTLTQVDPEWLWSVAPAEWYECYSGRFTSFRLPRSKQKPLGLARSTYHYTKRPKPGDEEVIDALNGLALNGLVAKHPAIWFWQSYHRLRRAGHSWNLGARVSRLRGDGPEHPSACEEAASGEGQAASFPAGGPEPSLEP